jgi:hypothetical protein
MITHTQDCIHPPMSPREDCEFNGGVWNQPQGCYVDEAEQELGGEAPWCAVRERAWELQDADEAEDEEVVG